MAESRECDSGYVVTLESTLSKLGLIICKVPPDEHSLLYSISEVLNHERNAMVTTEEILSKIESELLENYDFYKHSLMIDFYGAYTETAREKLEFDLKAYRNTKTCDSKVADFALLALTNALRKTIVVVANTEQGDWKLFINAPSRVREDTPGYGLHVLKTNVAGITHYDALVRHSSHSIQSDPTFAPPSEVVVQPSTSNLKSADLIVQSNLQCPPSADGVAHPSQTGQLPTDGVANRVLNNLTSCQKENKADSKVESYEAVEVQAEPCPLYQPYYTKLDQSAEFAIEKILVNEKDLYSVVQTIRLKPDCKVLALFGEIKSVLHAVSTVIGERIILPFPEKKEHQKKSCSIFVVMKNDMIIYFLPIHSDLLHKGKFDKENIIVTLFRFLQDFSSNILLCADTAIRANWYTGTKNPLSGGAHDHQIFKLEKQINTEFKINKIATSFNTLQQDLESDFFTHTVLNENNSRFFLHVSPKYACSNAGELELLKNSLPFLVNLLMRKSLLHNQREIKSDFEDLRLDSTNQLFSKVVILHKSFVEHFQSVNKYFQVFLRSNMNQVLGNLKALKHSAWTWSAAYKYENLHHLDSQYLSKKFNLLAMKYSELAIDKNIDRFINGKTHTKKCFGRLFEEYMKNVGEVIAEKLYNSTTTGDRKDVSKDVRDIMKNSKHSFKATLYKKAQLAEKLKGFRDEITKCFDDYVAEVKLVVELNFTPCVANIVLSNDGRYRNISYATSLSSHTSPHKVLPETLLDWFPEVRQFYKGDSSRLLKNVSVVSSYPMNCGRYFLVLLSMKCPTMHNIGLLITMSRCGIQRLVSLKPENFVMVVAEEEDKQLLYILDNKTREIVLLQIEDMQLIVQQSLCFLEDMPGNVISATLFPKKHRLLMLNDNGEMFEFHCRTNQITRMEIKKNMGKDIITKQLMPSHGETKYHQVYSLSNENFFLLKSKEVIDIYDSNLQYLYHFPINDSFYGLKVFADNINVYVSIVESKSITSYICPDLGSGVKLKLKGDEKTEGIKGNPIIDIIYASHLKYGPNAHFIGAPEKNYYYFLREACDSNFDSQLSSYLVTFPIEIAVKAVTLGAFRTQHHHNMTSHCLDSIMLSRVPLQIATLEGNNLVPLIDGTRQSLKALSSTLSSSLDATFLSFGHVEKIFEELCENNNKIRVISIVGKQSSGKSYLLNRLFGTRFSVAATRCTDGIWVSYTRLVARKGKNETFQDFLLLDCEGLFSIRRSELEETKLLTVLAAISDVTILNQDLNFSRHIVGLLKNLNGAVDRVKGDKYFKGFLMIAVRDVVSAENHKMAQELKRNIVELKGDNQFLTKLFNEVLLLQCFNNFSMTDIFAQEIGNVRSLIFDFNFEKYGILSEHWINSRECIDNLKILLLQLYNDDDQSSDEYLKKAKLAYIEKEILRAWGQIQKIGERASKSHNYTVSVVDHESAKIEFCQTDAMFDSVGGDDGYTMLIPALSQKFKTSTFFHEDMDHYNASCVSFNKFLNEVIEDRLECVRDYLNDLVGKLDKCFTDDEKKNAIVRFEEKLKRLSSNFSLCLETCCECNLKCTERKGHKDASLVKKTTIQKQIDENRQQLEKSRAARVELERYESSKQGLICEINSIDTDMQELKSKVEAAETYEKLCQRALALKAALDRKTQLLSDKKTQLAEFSNHDSFEYYALLYVSIREDCASDLNATLSKYCEITETLIKNPGSLETYVFSILESLSILTEIELKDLKIMCTQIDGIFLSDPSKEIHVIQDTSIDEGHFWMSSLQTFLEQQGFSAHNILNATRQMKAIFEKKETTLGASDIDNILIDKDRIPSLEYQVSKPLNNLSSSTISQAQKLQLLEEQLLKEQENILLFTEKEKSYQTKHGDMKQMTFLLQQQQFKYIEAQSKLFIMGLIQYFKSLNPYVSANTSNEDQKNTLVSQALLCDLTNNCSSADNTNQDLTEDQYDIISPKQISALEEKNQKMSKLHKVLEKQQSKLVTMRESGNDSDGEVITDIDIETHQKKITKTQESILQFACDIQEMEREIESNNCSPERVLTKLQMRFGFLLAYADLSSIAKDIANVDKEICQIQSSIDQYQKSRGAEIFQLESRLGDHGENVLLQGSDFSENREDLYMQKAAKVELLATKTASRSKLTEKLNRYINEKVDSCGATVTADDINNLKLKLETLDREVILLENEVLEIDRNITSMIEPQNESELKLPKSGDHGEELARLMVETVLPQKTELDGLMKQIKSIKKSRSVFKDQLLSLVFERYRSYLSTQLLKGSIFHDECLQTMFNEVCDREKIQKKMKFSWTVAQVFKSKIEQITMQSHAVTEDQFLSNRNGKKEISFNSPVQELCAGNLSKHLQIVTGISKMDKLFTAVESVFILTISKLENLIGLTLKHFSCIKEITELESLFLDTESDLNSTIAEKKRLDQLQSWSSRENADELKKQLNDLVLKREERSESVKELETLVQLKLAYRANQEEMKKLEGSLRCICQTNHKCDKFCGICLEKRPCKHRAGHAVALGGKVSDKELHICSKEKHDCQFKCEVNSCIYMCMYAADHSTLANHRCSSNHQCMESCRYCMNTCTKSLTEDHPVHICNERCCTSKCVVCGNACSGPHNHDESVDTVSDLKGEILKLHMCSNEHQCPNNCEVKGVCEVHYEEDIRTHKDPTCTQQYAYIKPVPQRKQCSILLKPGQYTHDAEHNCGCDHKCDNKCRECGSFCKEIMNHPGKHTTLVHRNKEFSYCVARTCDAAITINEEDSGKKARTYRPGEKFILETCMQQCKRKGRAHFHLIPCLGGDQCGQIKCRDGVKHCDVTERFYPFIYKVYDKFLCERFWEYNNWTMPCDDEEIKLCNYMCPSKRHDGAQVKHSFCTLPAWHCDSDLVKNHKFHCSDLCKGSVFSGIDICFCIDTTASMGKYIEECRSGIEKIMKETVEKLKKVQLTTADFRFAVVGYKDHCDKPVVQQKDFTSHKEAIEFLKTQQATGGGYFVPEAVLDGLDTATSLTWKETAMKLLFHILDAPPHGKQFWSGLDYHKTGCPCGRTESDVLRKLKEKNVTYYVVPLTTDVNAMLCVFENYIECIPRRISDTLDLSTLISAAVCEMIDDPELSAID